MSATLHPFSTSSSRTPCPPSSCGVHFTASVSDDENAASVL
eukprot:CAMPEP_0172089502 /NCGR_PEP_ID=MMETSP1043-20130122/23837_1 /TAXON_ID=464988 /ORGANISM="Hemiselmis andersenii, Strain CCMP441" /LENGTH=40 /DNA_ID= /DNA_START= /DNA_END= /DNA_ORIENTATION=